MKIAALIAIFALACDTADFRSVEMLGSDIKQPIFTEISASPIGVGPYAGEPAVADCNNDGNADILLACGTCCGSPAKPESGHVMVLLGDGRGNFAPAPASPVTAGRHPYDVVALGDVNGDGRLDIITPNMARNQVTVMLGDGKGGFQATPGSPLRPERAVWGTAIGDVNGDGFADIAMASGANASVVIMLGDGRGGFTAAAKQLRAGTWVTYVAMADFNKDGKPDLVASNYGSGDINVWLNATK